MIGMMEDKGLDEYNSIGKPIKWNGKYTYVTGERYEDHGQRTYDVNGYRLPSVTTILGATKNQQFLKNWKAKVGEQEAERIKNLSSKRGTSCLLYTSPSPRDGLLSRMPSSA